MPPLDPALREELRAWMGKARNDLRGIAVDLAAEPPLLEDALFHCQQVAEEVFEGFSNIPQSGAAAKIDRRTAKMVEHSSLRLGEDLAKIG